MTTITLRESRSLGMAFTVACLILSVSLASGVEPYFPVKSKRGEPGLRAYNAEWCGLVLHRMEEPRLAQMATNESAIVYRFTIIPTWGNDISIRIQSEGNVFRLCGKRLDGRGGFDPGKLVERKEFVLSEQESTEILVCLKSLNFFEMNTEDLPSGCDGEEWILEGVRDGKYHVVTRWSANAPEFDPDKRGLQAFVKFCSLLVDQASLTQRPKNKGHELIPPRSSVPH